MITPGTAALLLIPVDRNRMQMCSHFLAAPLTIGHPTNLIQKVLLIQTYYFKKHWIYNEINALSINIF